MKPIQRTRHDVWHPPASSLLLQCALDFEAIEPACVELGLSYGSSLRRLQGCRLHRLSKRSRLLLRWPMHSSALGFRIGVSAALCWI
jgi:hypothetical protein